MVYSALLPEVVGGVVDPRCVATPLAASLPSTRVLIGAVTAVDMAARTCTVRAVDGRQQVLACDRLVLNPGSVTGTFGVAGVVEHARESRRWPKRCICASRFFASCSSRAQPTTQRRGEVTRRSWSSAAGSSRHRGRRSRS
jgi:NADH dehydrogenase FAD-containing subunit